MATGCHSSGRPCFTVGQHDLGSAATPLMQAVSWHEYFGVPHMFVVDNDQDHQPENVLRNTKYRRALIGSIFLALLNVVLPIVLNYSYLSGLRGNLFTGVVSLLAMSGVPIGLFLAYVAARTKRPTGLQWFGYLVLVAAFIASIWLWDLAIGAFLATLFSYGDMRL